MNVAQILLPDFSRGIITAPNMFAVIGLCVVAIAAVRLAYILFRRFLQPSVSLSRFGANKGAWAVVTGASDGIGRQFSLDLAKKGFNVLLLSRTASKLEAVEKDIHDKYPKVQTRSVAVDFTDLSVMDRVAQAVAELEGPIGILVNNVGINYEYPKLYHDEDRSWDQKMIDVNIKVLNKMTDIVLPGMVSQGYGGIINLSSLVGMVPAPMLSTYTGTKAYIRYWSECLAHEYRSAGIAVMAITPGLTVSNMTKIKRASFTVSTPQIVAGRSLANLGRYAVYCPDNAHAFVEWFMGLDFWRSFVVDQVLKMNKGVQKAALRKKARNN